MKNILLNNSCFYHLFYLNSTVLNPYTINASKNEGLIMVMCCKGDYVRKTAV